MGCLVCKSHICWGQRLIKQTGKLKGNFYKILQGGLQDKSALGTHRLEKNIVGLTGEKRQLKDGLAGQVLA